MKYRTILADPPWSYPEGFAGGHARTAGKWEAPSVKIAMSYAGMPLADIQALPVAAWSEADCRLFLWATNKYLPDAFGVMAAWGFRYRQCLVWEKTYENLPKHIAPNSAEYVLVGVKGKPTRTGIMPSAIFRSGYGKQAHSAKPEAFIDMVEQVSPGPYLELFARRQRLGWSTWGLECFSVDADVRA